VDALAGRCGAAGHLGIMAARKPPMTAKHSLVAASKITKRKKTGLSGKQVHAIVARRLLRMDNLNFLESVAMFMGKAQLVELVLKNILIRKYGFDDEQIKRWTLGRLINELEDRGLRQGFIVLTEDLLEYRNYIAHEILADDALTRRLIGSRGQRFAWKRLNHGLYIVESIIVVHDFLFGDD
jgi:hypothetical protein